MTRLSSYRAFLLCGLAVAFCILGSFAYVAAQEDSDGNLQCPANDFYIYDSSKALYEKTKDGKVNLYGKTCISIEAKDEAATGKCVAAEKCEAFLCDGKPCAKPKTPVQSGGEGIGPASETTATGDDVVKLEPPKSPSDSKSFFDSTYFNSTPLKDQGGLMSPSGEGVQNQLQQAIDGEGGGWASNVKDAVVDSWRSMFNPEPLSGQQFELSGDGSPGDGSAQSVQTSSYNDGTAGSNTFQTDSGNLTESQRADIASQFSTSDGNTPSFYESMRDSVCNFGGMCGDLQEAKYGRDGYVVTAYGPTRYGYDPMQGGLATSRPNLEGKFEVKTLEDVRRWQESGGKEGSPYVSLATHPSNNGKFYDLGDVTYKNANGQDVTLKDVTGYSHDTGSAFSEGGCAKYGTCSTMYQKIDIAKDTYSSGSAAVRDITNNMPQVENVSQISRAEAAQRMADSSTAYAQSQGNNQIGTFEPPVRTSNWQNPFSSAPEQQTWSTDLQSSPAMEDAGPAQFREISGYVHNGGLSGGTATPNFSETVGSPDADPGRVAFDYAATPAMEGAGPATFRDSSGFVHNEGLSGGLPTSNFSETVGNFAPEPSAPSFEYAQSSNDSASYASDSVQYADAAAEFGRAETNLQAAEMAYSHATTPNEMFAARSAFEEAQSEYLSAGKQLADLGGTQGPASPSGDVARGPDLVEPGISYPAGNVTRGPDLVEPGVPYPSGDVSRGPDLIEPGIPNPAGSVERSDLPALWDPYQTSGDFGVAETESPTIPTVSEPIDWAKFTAENPMTDPVGVTYSPTTPEIPTALDPNPSGIVERGPDIEAPNPVGSVERVDLPALWDPQQTASDFGVADAGQSNADLPDSTWDPRQTSSDFGSTLPTRDDWAEYAAQNPSEPLGEQYPPAFTEAPASLDPNPVGDVARGPDLEQPNPAGIVERENIPEVWDPYKVVSDFGESPKPIDWAKFTAENPMTDTIGETYPPVESQKIQPSVEELPTPTWDPRQTSSDFGSTNPTRDDWAKFAEENPTTNPIGETYPPVVTEPPVAPAQTPSVTLKPVTTETVKAPPAGTVSTPAAPPAQAPPPVKVAPPVAPPGQTPPPSPLPRPVTSRVPDASSQPEQRPSMIQRMGSGISNASSKAMEGIGQMLGQLMGGGGGGSGGGGSQQPTTQPILPRNPTQPQIPTPPTIPTTPTPTTTPATTTRAIVTLISNPSVIDMGGTSALAWSSVGTTGCNIFAPQRVQIATGTPDGRIQTGRLATTTSFVAECATPQATKVFATTTVRVR